MHIIYWLLVLLGLVFVASVVVRLLLKKTGVWERMDNASQIAARERIRLAQFGCFVMGTRVVVGGQQNFMGLAFGPHLWMRRRDFGLPFLTSEGFPEAVARQVEGQIMAGYRLQISGDRNFLEGVFVPYRVEFSSEPPRVTAMHAQPPVPRKYRRIETIVDKEVAGVSQGVAE
jgi:hypothetical protein